MARRPIETRRTAQKAAVERVLTASPNFVSAQQVHQELHDEGTSVGLATVYRQLHALAASGRADTISSSSGQLFRSCDQEHHHHHLVCEKCGRAVEIDPPSEAWIQATAAEHGYTVTRHVFEVFGLCKTCADAARG